MPAKRHPPSRAWPAPTEPFDVYRELLPIEDGIVRKPFRHRLSYMNPLHQNLSGQIERITFSNPETGYTIARMRVKGRRELVTVVGRLMEPVPGEIIEMTGQWKIHPQYGEQFEIAEYRTTVPSTVHGIKKYLGSGMIKGIGPVMAERIVTQFGKQALNIIENECGRLVEVDGIGARRIDMIKKAWAEQKEIRSVMLFLQSHEVSAAYAVRIFRRYGRESVEVVRENPYRLATDIAGIGFLTADKIAAKLGFENASPLRIKAGILYVLNNLSDDGHVYYPFEMLIEKSREILEVDRETVVSAIDTVAAEQEIVIEDINESVDACVENKRAVYLKRLHVCETGIAGRFKRLIAGSKSIRPVDTKRAVDWVETQLAFKLADLQKDAIRQAVEQKVMVITGGPGTGKTTIIRAILTIFEKLHINIRLAAPTGRAAKRMSETTGYPAGTIHRMLSYNYAAGGFQKNEKDPLECDLLIVDEASMIDTLLMYHLLKAVPAAATLVFVGDVNQLPSVGPGSVLKDIIASRAVPVVRLSEIFRQARESRIVVNAHKINSGVIPKIDPEDRDTDFYFIDQAEPERVVDIIRELVSRRIPDRFGFDPVDDIQVLSPMHKGIAGTANLNICLQDTLNPKSEGLAVGGSELRIADKVMQVRNNYDKQVFNGDIGRITAICRDSRDLTVDYDGRQVVYDFNEVDEIVPAYAISVHKSQGSEYPVVVMPVLTQHYMLLQRNLIYTAVTRGRRLVVLVGTKRALAIGVRNDKPQNRYTRLARRLNPARRRRG